MSARLTPLIPGQAPPILLQRPVLLIGRHPECDMRIDLPKISRRHCCVALAYDRIIVRDLGSRNGLRVNGRLVEEAQLQPGDELAIGPILFRLDALEPVPQPTPAPARPAPPPRDPLPSLPASPADPEDSGLILLDDL